MFHVPTPLSLVPTQVLAVITSPSVLRERETEGHCFQDHREQGFREDDVGLAHLSGATHRNSSPSTESALSFLGSLNQGVEAQASLLPTPLRKGDISFLHSDK